VLRSLIVSVCCRDVDLYVSCLLHIAEDKWGWVGILVTVLADDSSAGGDSRQPILTHGISGIFVDLVNFTGEGRRWPVFDQFSLPCAKLKKITERKTN